MTKQEQSREFKRLCDHMLTYFPRINFEGVSIQVGGLNKYGLVLFSTN